ncbi:MAG: glycosyltransferase [Candidatus Bathyarchaeia archaeon]
MKPKVTIGICARNSAAIIKHAIESVIAQDFPHDQLEIIFVDDGSTDDTLRIAQRMIAKSDVLANFFPIPWSGIGKARNIVLNNAAGEYVLWVDSDEILEKDFVRKQFNLMEQNPKAGIGVARLGFSHDDNLVLALDLVPNIIEYAYVNFNSSAKLPGTGGAIYRVSAAREVGGFDESVDTLGEDIDIAKRIKDRGWLIVNGTAVFYEKHGGLGSWSVLWRRYVSRGAYSRKLLLKNRQLFSLYKINPIASFILSLMYVVQGYKITKSKKMLLLPIHFTLKMIAWFYGFNKASF